MIVYFSHGKESGPKGDKIVQLSRIANEFGCKVESIDYTGVDDPDTRIRILKDNLNGIEDDFVLVGSSMGGYVSLVTSELYKPKGLFLLAPALYIPGYEKQDYHPECELVEIVHGWSDEVIPPDNSIKFARSHNSQLHLIDGDHRLTGSLEVIKGLFSNFISTICDSNDAPARAAIK
jgi:alpha/beta superfamily hydrolase